MPDRLGSYRKDIQWISGLIFVLFLTVALLIGGAARLMAPETAKTALVNLFKNTLAETDSVKNFEQTKKNLSALSPKAYFRLPDIPQVGVTAGEAAKLDANGFVAKVSDDLAFRIYEGGTTAFNIQDQQAIGPLTNISRANYKKISEIGNGFWGIAILFGLIMFMFGRRYGRVFSLGFAMMMASLLPVIVFEFAVSSTGEPSTDPNAQLYTALIAGFKPAIIGSQQYVLKFVSLSRLLIIAALTGRVVYSLTASQREVQEQKKSDNTKGVHQTRLIELNVPYEKAYDLCMASLEQVKATVREEDRTLGKLTAKTFRGLSNFFKPSNPFVEMLFGIGETIKFELFKINEENTRIQVSSDPSVRTVIFDPLNYNLKNVEKITDFLNKETSATLN